MQFVDINGIMVGRCTQCLGIWFHGDGHKKLSRLKGSEIIDIGEAELGREFDPAENVPCPECGEVMDRVADPGQRHIHYEACGAGHGVFFDAGEYRDFRQKTLGDLFKGIFARS